MFRFACVMKGCFRSCGGLCMGAALALGVSAVSAAEKVWSGGAGDGLWSSAGNWSDGTVPSDGDAVVFPAVAGVVSNDITGLSLVSFCATNTADSAIFAGESLSVSSQIVFSSTAVCTNLIPFAGTASFFVSGAKGAIHLFSDQSGLAGDFHNDRDQTHLYLYHANALGNGTANDGMGNRVYLGTDTYRNNGTLHFMMDGDSNCRNVFYISEARNTIFDFPKKGNLYGNVFLSGVSASEQSITLIKSSPVHFYADFVYTPLEEAMANVVKIMFHAGGNGEYHFHGKLLFNKKCNLGRVWWHGWRYFYDRVSLGEMLETSDGNGLSFHSPYILDVDKLWLVGNSIGAGSVIRLNGNSQSVKTLGPFRKITTTPAATLEVLEGQADEGLGTIGVFADDLSVLVGGGIFTLPDTEHTMKGALIVTNDAVVTVQTGTTFTALSRITVKDRAGVHLRSSLYADPSTVTASLSVSDEGWIEVDEGLTVDFVTAIYGDTFLSPGTYTSADYAWIRGTGAITVASEPSIAPSTDLYVWTGSADNRWSTVGNWQVNGVVSETIPPNDGSARVLLDADGEVLLDSSLSVYSLNVASNRLVNVLPGNASALLVVGEGGIQTEGGNGDVFKTNLVFEANVKLGHLPQRVLVGVSGAVHFKGDVSSDERSVYWTLDTANTTANSTVKERVIFSGENRGLKCPLIFTNATVYAESDTALGMTKTVAYSHKGSLKLKEGVTVYNPIRIGYNPYKGNGDFNVYAADLPRVHVVQTNRFVGKVSYFYIPNVSTWRQYKCSVYSAGILIFDGGIECEDPGRIDPNYTSQIHFSPLIPCVVMTNRPISGFGMEIRENDWQPRYPKMVLGGAPWIADAEGTQFSVGNLEMDFVAENALGSSVALGVGYGGRYQLDSATVHLNGHSQTLGALYNETLWIQEVNRYPRPDGLFALDPAVVTSAVPACVTVDGTGKVATVQSKYPVHIQFTGQSALTYAGEGVMAFTNVVSDTHGPLRVLNGRVVFGYDSGWQGSTNVMIGAAGTIVAKNVNDFVAFGPNSRENKTVLTLKEGGKLVLHSDEAVDKLLLDRQKTTARGTYGGLDSDAQFKMDCFEGPGVLHVQRSVGLSFLMMIR